MARAFKLTEKDIKLLEEEIQTLSRNAREFMRTRPQEASFVVAIALEAAAAQSEAASKASQSLDIPGALKPLIVRRAGEKDILGVSEAATRLEVSRATIYAWARKGTLLAWKATKRGLNIPAAQILGPGHVVPGLADVADIIGKPKLAWAFLTQQWPFEDEMAAPLELLEADRIDEVLDAAHGYGSTLT